MNVNIDIGINEEEDGVAGNLSISRYRIEDAYGMAQFFSSVMQAAGFTYVKDVGFLYDDGKGATGRETLYIQQVGPYFAALRVFLADADSFHLSSVLERMVSSFRVDEMAAWGMEVAAINPAELIVGNTSLWYSWGGFTHYMGEVYNASPAAITGVQVRVAFCDSGGVVVKEVLVDVVMRRVEAGVAAPFAITIEGLPREVTACARQASAQPVGHDPSYTTALVLETTTELNRNRQLVMKGTVTNPNLIPVNNIDVLLIIYDEEGIVIGYELLQVSERLFPGQSWEFEHTFKVLGGTAHHAATFVQGSLVDSADPSLATTPEP